MSKLTTALEVERDRKEKYNGIIPEYRQVKVVEPHCPICKQRLMGNNSDISPWECPCGIWESSWKTDDAEMFGAGVCYNIRKHGTK